MGDLIPLELIENKIYMVRGHRVILDKDLAILYKVGTRDLNKAVSRNLDRFPGDFMFQLTEGEFKILMFQFGTSRWGGTRKMPRVFTEQGVAMLSSVLQSKKAVQVNIVIMRAFVRLREILLTNKDLAAKIEALELKYKNHNMKFSENDEHIASIFEAIRQLMEPPPAPPKPKIGFHQH